MPCWKLVRDRIGEQLAKQGDAYIVQAKPDEREPLLRAKIVEEAMELAESSSLEEAADLLEALHAWLHEKGYTWSQLEEERQRKLKKKGGFTKAYIAIWPNRHTC